MTKEEKTYILNWVKTVIAILSIIVAVYSIATKEKQKALDAARILNLSNKLLQTQSKITVYEELIRNNQKKNVLLNSQIELYQHREDSLMRENNSKLSMINTLKRQLNEVPEPLNLTDDQHYQFFLEWTKP